MRITIITVVYNRANTVEQTILSVLGQTYKDIEYIIIDGGSDDGTVSIIKKYEVKISYWISEKDKGIYHAMNKGILRASGDYIQFLNADDFLIDKDRIRLIVKKLYEFDMPDVLSAPVWIVDEKRKIQKLHNNNVNVDEIKRGKSLPHQGIFMKKDVLKNYKFNEHYKIVSDGELILRCILDGKKFCFTDEPVVFYSNDGISGGRSISDIRIQYDELYHVLCKYVREPAFTENFRREKRFYLHLYKKFLKDFLEILHCMGFIRRIQGWQEHRCTNEFCRWCKSGEKMNQ